MVYKMCENGLKNSDIDNDFNNHVLSILAVKTVYGNEVLDFVENC